MMTSMTRAALPSAPTDHHGRIRVGDKYNAPICVAQRNQPRALRILDALIKTLAARGAHVEVGSRYPHGSREEIVVR